MSHFKYDYRLTQINLGHWAELIQMRSLFQNALKIHYQSLCKWFNRAFKILQISKRDPIVLLQTQFFRDRKKKPTSFESTPYPFNPLSSNGDQHQFPPNNIHTLSREKVMRIAKMITKEKMPWSFIKFFQQFLTGNVWRSVWRICIWILGVKGLCLNNNLKKFSRLISIHYLKGMTSLENFLIMVIILFTFSNPTLLIMCW